MRGMGWLFGRGERTVLSNPALTWAAWTPTPKGTDTSQQRRENDDAIRHYGPAGRFHGSRSTLIAPLGVDAAVSRAPLEGLTRTVIWVHVRVPLRADHAAAPRPV